MKDVLSVLTNGETAVYKLRALYQTYGYQQYKMSKFEEYDLYVSNKDYLVSDNVITFNDTDGKLLALKPDVTLSIIKNGKDDGSIKKLCYGENVYRVSKGTKSFKEIMQVGLECQGNVDDFIISEVLMLAVLSLKSISSDYALDISHLGVVSSVINGLGVSESVKKELISYLGDKNGQAIKVLLEREGVSDNKAELLLKLVEIYGNPKTVIKQLSQIDFEKDVKENIAQLEKFICELERLDLAENVNIDFSVVNNMSYYNGIVFKGFISGIPTGILSGGQYDNLMQKMGKKSGAIGFAVYLDELKNLSREDQKFDVDVVVLYDDSNSIKDVNQVVKEIVDGGETAFMTKTIPEKLRFKRQIKVK